MCIVKRMLEKKLFSVKDATKDGRNSANMIKNVVVTPVK